MPKEQLQWSF